MNILVTLAMVIKMGVMVIMVIKRKLSIHHCKSVLLKWDEILMLDHTTVVKHFCKSLPPVYG